MGIKTPAIQDNRIKDTSKIIWLSIVQGWAILAVIIGHVNGFTYSGSGNEMYPLSGAIHKMMYAFHMPLFMFVSGGLLYFTRIQKNWDTSALYRDKLKRLMIPYLFFTMLALIIKSLLSSYTKRGFEITPHSIIDAFLDPANGPLAEMWFIGTLMWLMLLYPVYKLALRSLWGEVSLVSVTLVLFFASGLVHFSGWLNLSAVPEYAFFFVAGMLFFKYTLYRYFESRLWPAIILTLLFVVEVYYLPVGRLLTAGTGILMSCAWGVWVADRMPRLFSTFRDYSFQIFLMGLFPQMFVELFLWKRFHNEWLQVPYYFLSCLLAISIAIIASKGVMRANSRWLKWCFGLK